ncbi:hypothetical protein [Pseudogemmobacter sp. W21_MBD1_M6]|uniref:hypothetical protein n=1 Tax=Pseudogemmobacter sp. W21_MBD1_M6 TaxID=3240271 RepID=UPI003F98FD8B
MRIFIPFAAAALMALPAHAFTAMNGLSVNATGPTEFTVPYSGNSDTTAFWCAAGDYVIRSLNMSRFTRIYRTSEPPRRSGQPIDFSLSPERAASKTGVIILGGDGKSISADMAVNFCKRPVIRLFK